LKARSYFPTQKQPVWFAISADDLLLHFQKDELNAKQRVDDRENKDLICMLQVGSLFLGKPGDRASFYEGFQAEPWKSLLQRYHHNFQRMGLNPVRLEDACFYPRDDFYRDIGNLRQDELLTVYLVSGSNARLHDAQTLAISRRVNSKMYLAEQAARWNIPVPATFVTTRQALDSSEAHAFLNRYGPEVMLKVMGLAGARNVTTISSIEQALAWVAELRPQEPVLLQQKLSFDQWAEMTVDLYVSDGDLHIDNLRKILFANGLWVGNHIRNTQKLGPAQQAALLRVGEFVRSEGYTAPEGLNCGLDFFVPKDGRDDVIVTEINARFTGGLMPAEVVRRLQLGVRDTVVCFATVGRDRLDDYLAFNERHLYGDRSAAFATLPLGFSPYTTEIDGREMVFVWQMVWGDFDAAVAAKNQALGSAELGVLDLIKLEPGQ
jgi:hypothetical protein